MKKFCKRILMFSISLIVIFSLTMSLYTPATAMAATASAHFKENVTISHTKNYNKDGKLYVRFKFSNSLYGWVDFGAKVVNSSGKTVYKYSATPVGSKSSKSRDYGASYSGLPKGMYTFILTAYDRENSLTWQYSVRHKHPPSISFKSFEKVRDSKGVMRYQFNIQCTNIKGEKLTIKIYDSNGNVVYKATGPARKTDNEVGFFGWSGLANVGSKQKCKSGQYTVEVFSSGVSNGIQNTYTLIY